MVFAVAIFILGIYFSYVSVGLSIALIPSVISSIGISFLFTEMATGNIEIVNLIEWKKIEIGAFGKLSLLFTVFGGLVNSAVVS